MTQTLPTCKWRGAEVLPEHWACASPLLVVTGAAVPPGYCQTCQYANRDLPAWLADRPAPPAPGPRPGTELVRLIRSLGLHGEAGCGCGSLAARMDAWGVEGCDLRREEILARLRGNAAKLGWLDWLRAGGSAALQGLALNPLDPAPGLLDEAMRRARGKDGEEG